MPASENRSKPIEVATGHFEKKQILSSNRLVAWSHRSRFERARELLQPLAGGRLLDYGTGDGTLLKQCVDLFPNAVGADMAGHQVDDCRKRFAGLPRLTFVSFEELLAQFSSQSFDVITCMEVMEHLTSTATQTLLRNLATLLRPRGTIIISVPVETGLPLLVKQVVRVYAGWRGVGDYKYAERYTLGELCRMICAGSDASIRRPLYGDNPGCQYHGHKGFNWRGLRRELMTRFTLRETNFSPLNFGAGQFASQVWFICEPRA
jgi:SAM-dependent methyltransferase